MLLSLFFLTLLAFPALARADDWIVTLGEVEVRKEPGFSKAALEKSLPFSPYKVLGKVEAKGEGSQIWYEIVLREDRRVRKQQSKGWVLQLKNESSPLMRSTVPVYKTPDTGALLGEERSADLQLTGLKSPDGQWHEVGFQQRFESVRHTLGYVPASLAWESKDPDLTQLIPRLDAIRQSQWPLKWKAACVQGKILKGFPRAAVRLALGEPDEIRAPDAQKTDEIWTYLRSENARVHIFFRDGRVVGWKQVKN